MSEATQSLGKVRHRKNYPEIDAMKRMDDMLATLTADSRLRVLRWLADRWFSQPAPVPATSVPPNGTATWLPAGERSAEELFSGK